MYKSRYQITSHVVDIHRRRIFPANVTVEHGRIIAIEQTTNSCSGYLIPGFVDAHVHVESSMLVPSEFARAAVVHGTIATVSDPHEIGNVLGVTGVQYMLENAQQVPFKFCFGAPSCVPATKFETSGAEITLEDVETLLADDRIGYLSEVMNFPGVLNADPIVMGKIRAAIARGKPIDGHAPGLRGELARDYFSVGITTDHECFTKQEALDKLAVGCKIAIREGSAARNYDALYELIDEYPDQVMLCSDDKHPDELIHGHINQLATRSIAHGMDLFNVLKATSVNAVEHYKLNVGLLREGDPADFVEVKDLHSFQVLRTFIDGQLVADHGQSLIETKRPHIINHFHARSIEASTLEVVAKTNNIEVIQAFDGQLVTQRATMPVKKRNGCVVADLNDDVLKLVVLNRYQEATPAVAFVSGFKLKEGAIASSVAHDSHNIIAVGVDDRSLTNAINRVVEMQGGLAVAKSDQVDGLPLSIAGLMSPEPIEIVSAKYSELDAAVKKMGCQLRAPFMTLSFMGLLVIPELKLSDLGLFDGFHFRFADLFV